ncbi:hypothetical protein ACWC9R_21080 [Streptomyces sp. NPDC001219]
MRTIPTIRRLNGAEALIPARTAGAPQPHRYAGDLRLPMPEANAALPAAAGPAPASGATPSAPAPHRTHPLHTPPAGSGSAAVRRRTTTADSPAGRVPLPVLGESARHVRTAAAARVDRVPGADERPVPAFTAACGERLPFPCTGGGSAVTEDMEFFISASPKGNWVPCGTGRSVRTGSVPVTAARVTGTRPAAPAAAEFSNKA